MRISCLECVRKHLGSAGVFLKETKMGYSAYDIWVIGELEHAADECLEVNRDLALVIREHRLAWTEDSRHFIPFEDFNKYIKACMLAENEGIEMPKVPEELYVGLQTNEEVLLIHEDTR